MPDPTPAPAQATPPAVTPPAMPPPVIPPVTPPVTPPAPASPHDAAIAAVEAWQTNPTPELKSAAQEAVKKAKESQPAVKVAPEKYDLKLPEGSKLDAKHLEAIATFAKERGLSQDDAAALLERDNSISKAQQEKQAADFKTYVESFIPLAKADKEFGGVDFEKNVQLAQRVVTKFGNEGLKKMLDETGFGNHLEVLRAFWKIGKAMKDDELVISPTAPAPKKSMEENFYGPPK